MCESKISQFPLKRWGTTVELTYTVDYVSYYEQLKSFDEDESKEVLTKYIHEFEMACKEKLEELKEKKLN